MRGCDDLAAISLAAWLGGLTGCASTRGSRSDASVADTGAAPDIEGATFRSIAPCPSEADYRTPLGWDGWIHVVAAPAYSPRCLKAAPVC